MMNPHLFSSFVETYARLNGLTEKQAADLTAAARHHVAAKNFALTPGQSSTGESAYPIHDRAHAVSALSRVRQHGSPAQAAEVYKDVAKKYPELAARSSVPGVRDRAEKQASIIGGIGQRLSSAGGGLGKRVGEHLIRHGNAYDLGGLGVLAAPAVAGLGQAAGQAVRGEKVNRKDLLHNAAETAGLGLIAAPVAASMLMGRGHG